MCDSQRLGPQQFQQLTTQVSTGLLAVDWRVDMDGREFHLILCVNVESGAFYLFKTICGEDGCIASRHASRADAELQRQHYLTASQALAIEH